MISLMLPTNITQKVEIQIKIPQKTLYYKWYPSPQRFSVFCIFLPLVMLSFHQAHFPPLKIRETER